MLNQLRNWAFLLCLTVALASMALWVTSCVSPIGFRVASEPVSPAAAFEFQSDIIMGIALKPGYLDVEYIGDSLESLQAGDEVRFNSVDQTVFLGDPWTPADKASPTGVIVNYANSESCRGVANDGKWHDCFTSPIAFTSGRWSQCCYYQGAFGKFVFLEIPFLLPTLIFGYWPALRLFRWACRRSTNSNPTATTA